MRDNYADRLDEEGVHRVTRALNKIRPSKNNLVRQATICRICGGVTGRNQNSSPYCNEHLHLRGI